MKRLIYIFIILISSCHSKDTDNIIPIPQPIKYPSINISQSVDTIQSVSNSFGLLGCGYDCTFDNFKGTSYVRAKVIDIERFIEGKGYDQVTNSERLMLPGNINEALLYESGHSYSIIGSNLEEYINALHLQNNVSSNIQDVELELFTKDVKKQFFLSQENSYYRIDYLKPTHRLTLSEVYVEYLKYFLSSEFINDLATMQCDEVIAKYGTHVLTDILLGGAVTILCSSKLTDYSTHADFKKEASYFCNSILNSNSDIEPPKIFKSSEAIDIYIKIVGGSIASVNTDNSVAFDFNNWVKCVNRNSEQIIAIGNNTTKIHLLSEFVDNPVKRDELESAIKDYCNQHESD